MLSAVVTILIILGITAVCVVCRKKSLYRGFIVHKTTDNNTEKSETLRVHPDPTAITVQEDGFVPTSTDTRKRPSGGRDYQLLHVPRSSTQRCGESGEITDNDEQVEDIKHLVQNVSAERYMYSSCKNESPVILTPYCVPCLWGLNIISQ